MTSNLKTNVTDTNTTLAIMAVFYITYFAKQISQRKQGINTMILGEGNKPKNQKRLEIMLKVATFIMPAVEIASIWWNLMERMRPNRYITDLDASLFFIFFNLNTHQCSSVGTRGLMV